MKVLRTLVVLLAAAALPAAALPAAAQTGGLVSTLVSKLGVTNEQASGGAGSILGYAKQNLSVDDFAKVAKAVPETDGLIKSAPTSGGDLLGGANLGGTLGSVAGAAAVGSSFQKLGLSGDMVGKFAPIVLDYFTAKGGSSVGSTLGGALGGLVGGGGTPPAAQSRPAPATPETVGISPSPVAGENATAVPAAPTATATPAAKKKSTKKKTTKK